MGVYLSGGLDSGLVTAIAARHAPGPVYTHALYFGPKHPHELPFVDRVVARSGTRHRVLSVTPRRVKRAFDATMAALDDPIGDPLTVPNLLLGRMARQENDVILNGEGRDGSAAGCRGCFRRPP